MFWDQIVMIHEFYDGDTETDGDIALIPTLGGGSCSLCSLTTIAYNISDGKGDDL